VYTGDLHLSSMRCTLKAMLNHSLVAKKTLAALATLLLVAVALLPAIDVDAAVSVRGYFRKDGTYVKPHYRSAPDGNPYNNWSFPGNTNPYTGKVAPGNPSTYLDNYYDRGTSSSPTTSALDELTWDSATYKPSGPVTYEYGGQSITVPDDSSKYLPTLRTWQGLKTGSVAGASTIIPGFVSSLAKMHHSKINALFRYANDGKNPTVSENRYWISRLEDKPLVGDMLGAMQWHQAQGIQH